MRRSFRLVVGSAIAAFAAPAFGQHAGFVLFGDPNPAAAAVTPNRKAVHPITSPYFHEDSFVTTDLRAWFAYHTFPNSIALAGGHAKVYALQVRVALTDQLQLVAYKDGYVDFNTGLIQDDGWNDLAAGLKWNFYQDFENDLHAAAGVGYQFAVGDPSVLQNDQELRLWASVNKGFDNLHLGATVNYLVHTGHEDALGSSDRLFWHLHADYHINEYVSPVLEFNGYHTVRDGDNDGLPFSGSDVVNLGGGDDVVTVGVGVEVRPIRETNFAVRVAYETALTSGEDLWGNRWTISAVYGF